MTSVVVYDTSGALLEDIATRHDVPIAEVIEAMLECFSANNGEEYL